MLTRKAFSLLPVYMGAFLQEPATTDKDLYFEAKDLLIKGTRLRRSIELFEKSGYADSQFLILCACVGRLASIAFATLEWNGYLQEKDGIEFKAKRNLEFKKQPPPVCTPDDGKDFDLNSPTVPQEIEFLAQKILSYCTRIDKTLSRTKAPEERAENLKNRHLYISALVLLNRTLRIFSGRFTTNTEITEVCAVSKILIQVDRYLELQPNSYEMLYLKAIVKTLSLIHIYPETDYITFSLGDPGRLNIDKKDIAESISCLDTVTSKSLRLREATLYKSMLLYFQDKSKSIEQLDTSIQSNPSVSILYLFKSELLFQTKKADFFEPLRQAGVSPILGDFSFSLPIRYEIQKCFGYLKWTSSLSLARSLSALFSYTEYYFQSIKPENMSSDHLAQIEVLLNLSIRTIDTFRRKDISSYQETASHISTVSMGISNAYSAYHIVHTCNTISPSKEKSDFLKKYAGTLEYVKKVDAELTLL